MAIELLDDTHNKVCYKKNHLKSVVARVDFEIPIRELVDTIPPQLHKQALKNFPVPDPGELVTKTIQLTRDSTSTASEGFKNWEYYGIDRKKKTSITKDHMFVEYFSYESFTDIERDFLSLVQELETLYPEVGVKRIGLRYVNQIQAQGANILDWDEYISPDILGLLGYEIPNALPVRNFHILEFRIGDSNLRFQFGLFNPDYPSPIRQRQFILDFDAYTLSLSEMREVRMRIEEFHGQIQSLFEHVITDGLRNELNS